MLTLLVVEASYVVLFCAVFLVQLKWARVWQADRQMGWFLTANGASDLTNGLVVLLVLLRTLHGTAGAYALATALAVQATFYTWRVWLGRRMAGQKRGRRMRFKIDPEIVRFVQAITAGLMGMAAVLTGTDAIPPVGLIWIVAVGALLQGWGAVYGQGVQTEPPHGMLTEEYTKATAEPAAPKGTAPAAGSTYAAGRASVAPMDADPL